MSLPWRTRRGFGTTATFVLVIIGITLLILLGGDMLSRGSRITIERAYITGQMLRVANMALDEAMAGEVGREKLGEQMLSALTGGSPPPKTDTAARDQLINDFLAAITPCTPNNVLVDIFPNIPDDEKKEATVQHEYPWNDPNNPGTKTAMMFWRNNGRVIFGIDKPVKFTPETLKLAYKTEIDNGTLKVHDVEMRCVAFKAALEDSQSGVAGKVRKPFVPDQTMGFGLCRAKVKVDWVLPRQVEGKSYTLSRTVMSERFFELQAPKVIGGSGTDGEWLIDMHPGEWQREAIGD